MLGQVRSSAVMAIMGCGLLVASCSPKTLTGWMGNPLTVDKNVGALGAATSNGTASGPFTTDLASEYYTFAYGEDKGAYDFVDADYFARKGLSAAQGQAVPPEELANWRIPPDKVGELAAARDRLTRDLDAGGRDRLPAIAARAQARFDCWVKHQEDNWQINDIAFCRNEFLAAVAQLESPAVPVAPGQMAGGPSNIRQFRIYFDWDRSNLTPEAMNIVRAIVAQYRAGGSSSISLVGKADRTGTDAYNLALATRRDAAVRASLVQNGVPANMITQQAVGDSQPEVPTPNGVREPRNRVVIVGLR